MIQELISEKMPDQLKLSFALWTRHAVQELITRVRQLQTQVSDFIRPGFKNCHYSKVSCSGSRGFVRFKATKTLACSMLVVDSPALGCDPFRVMR